MALYVMRCDSCGLQKKKLLDDVAVANAGLPCPAQGCTGSLWRETSAPSVHTKEVLRFGHQIRDVERYDDAEKLYDERAHMDPRKAD